MVMVIVVQVLRVAHTWDLRDSVGSFLGDRLLWRDLLSRPGGWTCQVRLRCISTGVTINWVNELGVVCLC